MNIPEWVNSNYEYNQQAQENLRIAMQAEQKIEEDDRITTGEVLVGVVSVFVLVITMSILQ